MLYLILLDTAVKACPTCMSGMNSKEGEALKSSVLALLIIIVFLLIGFAIFFLALRKKARYYEKLSQAEKDLLKLNINSEGA